MSLDLNTLRLESADMNDPLGADDPLVYLHDFMNKCKSLKVGVGRYSNGLGKILDYKIQDRGLNVRIIADGNELDRRIFNNFNPEKHGLIDIARDQPGKKIKRTLRLTIPDSTDVFGIKHVKNMRHGDHHFKHYKIFQAPPKLWQDGQGTWDAYNPGDFNFCIGYMLLKFLYNSEGHGNPIEFMRTIKSLPITKDFEGFSQCSKKKNGAREFGRFTLCNGRENALEFSLQHVGPLPGNRARYFDFPHSMPVNVAQHAREHSKDVNIEITYKHYSPTLDASTYVSVHANQPLRGRYVLSQIRWSGEKIDELKSKFGDVTEYAKPGDYRPWLHRIIEIADEVPKEQWHNPYSYTLHSHDKPNDNGQKDAEQLEAITNETVNLLFTGKEKNEIEKRVKLNMRDGWASVPRLNLGAIRLPAPGQRDVMKDEYVMKGSTYLLECLTQTGMPHEEAEALMARKLTNYFVHKSGFQLNRKKAGNIVEQLKYSKKPAEASYV